MTYSSSLCSLLPIVMSCVVNLDYTVFPMITQRHHGHDTPCELGAKVCVNSVPS